MTLGLRALGFYSSGRIKHGLSLSHVTAVGHLYDLLLTVIRRLWFQRKPPRVLKTTIVRSTNTSLGSCFFPLHSELLLCNMLNIFESLDKWYLSFIQSHPNLCEKRLQARDQIIDICNGWVVKCKDPANKKAHSRSEISRLHWLCN